MGNKRYVEALMIEDGLKARKIVRRILKNRAYQCYFPNQRIIKRMISELNEADRVVNRLIEDGKRVWKREVKWVNPNKGTFTLDKYLNDLWKRYIIDVYMEINESEFITAYWLFSSTRIYS